MASLDRAGSSRVNCAWCGKAIAKGTVRVRAKRPAHLACAIEHEPELAREALLNKETTATIVSEVLAEISRLDPDLADAVRAGRARVKGTRAAKALDDPETAALLGELEADPGDRDLLTVLGDHLQQRGDERGELIVLDLAASEERAALVRRRELCIRLAPPFSVTARPTWGIGFLRKLELGVNGGSLADHAATFAHPSCRLLESLTLGTYHRLPVTIPDGVLPRSLRTLQIHMTLGRGSDLSGLPHLAHVELMDTDGRLVHPSLSSLSLHDPSRETLERLSPEHLPALRRIVVERCSEPFLETLVPFLSTLDELVLELCAFDEDAHALLERALDGRKLKRLAIAPRRNMAVDRHRLQALCEELDVPSGVRAPDGPAFVEHVGKPEWGRGRVVREFDGKLEVAFPSGTRTLKADAPFLRRTRE